MLWLRTKSVLLVISVCPLAFRGWQTVSLNHHNILTKSIKITIVTLAFSFLLKADFLVLCHRNHTALSTHVITNLAKHVQVRCLISLKFHSLRIRGFKIRICIPLWSFSLIHEIAWFRCIVIVLLIFLFVCYLCVWFILGLNFLLLLSLDLRVCHTVKCSLCICKPLGHYSVVVVVTRADAIRLVASGSCSIGNHLVDDKITVLVWSVSALCGDLLTFAIWIFGEALLPLSISEFVLSDHSTRFEVGTLKGSAC